MTALIIIGIILGILFFLWLGYYLWSTAREKYDHNIFGIGVIIRGVASLFCLTFAVMLNTGDGSLVVWLAVACILKILPNHHHRQRIQLTIFQQRLLNRQPLFLRHIGVL
jgi:tellurite resistance protein TehA-like permease